ncbi:hypothetical protein [Pedobacter foliorum]|uniref:hypothetical protein n=1 Tax=Pedobacter foliorum TaxID=2739058 RepID=UPI001565ADE0|nr:hypothetical protein [Pedobacter foliorum]NRF37233.1 hypothetical protein [Pedobacter foliorum]
MRILSILTLLVIFAGCESKNKSTETPQYTITHVEGSKNLYLITNEFTGVIIAPDTMANTQTDTQFMPSIQDIFKAESIFKKCLTGSTPAKDGSQIDSTIIKSPSQYIRQYVGYKNKQGEKTILLNCFTKESVSKQDYWKKDIIVITDGGNNYFSINVNLTKENCSNFNTNRKS